jgi:hypothetical protein
MKQPPLSAFTMLILMLTITAIVVPILVGFIVVVKQTFTPGLVRHVGIFIDNGMSGDILVPNPNLR